MQVTHFNQAVKVIENEKNVNSTLQSQITNIKITDY